MIGLAGLAAVGGTAYLAASHLFSSPHTVPVPKWHPLKVEWWHDNQVAIMLHVDQHRSLGLQGISEFLGLEYLRQFLSIHGFNLKPFGPSDISHSPYRSADISHDFQSDDINAPYGKFLFSAPDGQGVFVISCFHVEQANTSLSPHASDYTRQVVSLINRNLDKLRQGGNVPIVAAMPNWLGGATPDGGGDGGSFGCPTCPPLPVPDGDASIPGRWTISLPELSPEMQSRTGEGVTVFVLDTIPTAEQITTAAARVGSSNLQLRDFAALIGTSIVIDHQKLPDRLDVIPVPATGDDVYGRLVGFEMPDHGLFVAGIIHDIAPKAKIECVRVLNDFGVGNVGVLCQALEDIERRMDSGELKHVVINLSLVTTPHDEELIPLWFEDNCCSTSDLTEMAYEAMLMRAGLHMAIKGLTARGAVIVSSAGNGSDINRRRRWMTTQIVNMPTRLEPRYPAAFPEMISVGAVDGNGAATTYSNYPAVYPQHNGIATLGGDLPIPIPPLPNPTDLTKAEVKDPVCGLYSADSFPALSAEDMVLNRPNPPVANTNGWAYWSGTSFATPIISAVAARVLESISASGVSVVPSQLSARVQWAITSPDGQQEMLTGSAALPTNTAFNVGMLKAEQAC